MVERRAIHPEWYAAADGGSSNEAAYLDSDDLMEGFGDEEIRLLIRWDHDVALDGLSTRDKDEGSWEQAREFTMNEVEGSLSDDRINVSNFTNGKYSFYHIGDVAVTIRGETRRIERYDDINFDARLTITALNCWLNEGQSEPYDKS